MIYHVKEIFYTIQGEGMNTGRPAVFCRFSGCNLWSGYEQHRASAICKFCDTDFVGGNGYSEQQLVESIAAAWPKKGHPFCVFTGGEPGLQLTESLLRSMRRAGFFVAVETNGTISLPDGVYHITVSPKHGSTVVQKTGHELKVVWPQPFDLSELSQWKFRRHYLQPMEGVSEAAEKTVNAVLANPKWRLSLQTHKILGLR